MWGEEQSVFARLTVGNPPSAVHYQDREWHDFPRHEIPACDMTETLPPAEPAPSVLRSLRSAPIADRIAWGGFAIAIVGFLVGLAEYWGANPAYADRLLVLVAAGWVTVQTWPILTRLPLTPRPILGLPLVLFGTVAIPVAWYLQARTGTATLLLWWQLLALIITITGWILMRQGASRLRAFAFALLVPLFALPIPGLILRPLQAKLQGATTTVAYYGLSATGLGVQRSGLVLQLPSGDLGVAEACSGIRSLTALTALAAFIAYLRGFGPIRGVSLVVLSIPVVVTVNVFRVILTGLIQEHIGGAYVRNDWHEGLGFAMVLLGLGLILGVASLLEKSADTGAVPPPTEPTLGASWVVRPWSGWVAATLAIGMIAGAAGAIALSQSVKAKAIAAAPLDDFPMKFPNWQGETRKIPHGVTEMLNYDRAIQRVYRNNLGQEVHVWIVYWAAATAARGYHHPDVCWPSRGFKVSERKVEAIPTTNGSSIPAMTWEFQRNRDRQFVLCWTQDGNQIRSAEEDRSVVMRLNGQAWVQDLLGLNEGPNAEPRLMVLVGDPIGTPSTKRATLEFVQTMLPAIYEICPWGNPAATSTTQEN